MLEAFLIHRPENHLCIHSKCLAILYQYTYRIEVSENSAKEKFNTNYFFLMVSFALKVYPLLQYHISKASRLAVWENERHHALWLFFLGVLGHS